MAAHVPIRPHTHTRLPQVRPLRTAESRGMQQKRAVEGFLVARGWVDGIQLIPALPPRYESCIRRLKYLTIFRIRRYIDAGSLSIAGSGMAMGCHAASGYGTD